ncbi:MAG TPA: xanthine dehydrogenase family protein molybdopterin-binding subunit [Chloroflexota bacterium]|nr:xanthine dehydrogenase family protein molybdopterin-binding subunit [Chloroflexota bacterium]
MTTTERPTGANVVLSTTKYNVVGTRPIRHDGVDKVTGRAVYGADVKLPGLLYGRVLRSIHTHARIKRVDTSRAEAYPGVRAVVTAKDLPAAEDRVEDLGEGSVNLKFLSDNVLVGDKALYRGHAIAAVAAIDQHVAEEAVRLIEVEYEFLPPVIDVLEAMKDTSPLVHENQTTESFGQKSDKKSNVAKHIQHLKGDPDVGFAEADVVVEREFRTSTVHQGYIEPHSSTALWNADGNLTVWTCTQGAFPVRDQLSKVLDLPVSNIKVIPTEIGGGFGGKIPLYLEPVAAVLSRKTGRPVKLTMSRANVFQGTGPSPGSYMKVKIGATRDGRITAATADLMFEAGAYPGSPIGAAAQCIFAPYEVPHGRIDGYDVLVNKPRSFAYRAPGATQAAFAGETVIDEICEKIGMDPLEFRLKNAAKEGTRRVDGVVFPRIGCVETNKAAQEHPHYNAPLEGPNRGRGVATGFWFNIGEQSSVTISVNSNGAVHLVEGSTDIGGTRTSIAMQAAEILGIPAEDVRPSVVDTDSIGFTAVTGGSRTTFATGIAAIEAARDVVFQMCERAAEIWEVAPDTVTYDKGVFASSADSGKRMTFKELASQLKSTGGLIVGRANPENETGHGGAFATHIVDVEVDPETGKVQILRYTAVQDAGKAIHPSYVEGQMQGGAVQGIGWALNEEYFLDDRGDMLNASFLDYRMPTSLDVPMIDTVIVEVANPGHPFGVRGVGEVPIVPPPAAIANAIYRAIGVRLTDLPMSPGKVLRALGKVSD